MDKNEELKKDVNPEEVDDISDELDNETFTYTIDNNNINNDYSKRNYNDNKSFIYIAIGVLVLIFIIVLLVIFANKGNSKVKGYSNIESRMVSAAKNYYTKYTDKLPIMDGASVNVSAETLIENSYLKPFSEMVNDGVSCSGYVNVFKIGDEYSYFPYLNCGSEYESSLLSKNIIDSGVVTSGDGLYLIGDKYIFRGEYPNNYIKFDGSLWRIIGINNDGSIKLIYSDKKVERYSWDDRYNSFKDSYVGINDFRVSRLLEYLNDIYDKNTYVNKSNKNLLVKHDWCIGKVSQEDSSISSLNLCSDTYSDLYIGVVKVDDVLIPSLDSKCSNIYDVECTNYNYFFTINTGWTLNAVLDNTYSVFSSNGGSVSYKNASTSGYVRPVINLNSNILYKSGTGTSDDPYVINN
ncbi:MAG: hypothetical protein ACI31V_00715 [Bacilli bacterium]